MQETLGKNVASCCCCTNENSKTKIGQFPLKNHVGGGRAQEKIEKNKIGVISDPLGQPTVPAGSDFRSILKFSDGCTDRKHL